MFRGHSTGASHKERGSGALERFCALREGFVCLSRSQRGSVVAPCGLKGALLAASTDPRALRDLDLVLEDLGARHPFVSAAEVVQQLEIAAWSCFAEDHRRLLDCPRATKRTFQLHAALMSDPVTSAAWVVERLGVSKPSANRAVETLIDAGILG